MTKIQSRIKDHRKTAMNCAKLGAKYASGRKRNYSEAARWYRAADWHKRVADELAAVSRG